jgi:hypothetical protein
MRGAAKVIITEVTSWPDVTSQPGRFGSTQFVVGKREVGHVHGDSVVDIPCRKEKREEWIASGRAEQHRFAPGFGVTVFVHNEKDLKNALDLLRESYALVLERLN